MASIQKRGKNSWRLIVEAGTNSDGSRKQEKKTIRVEDKDLLKTTKKLQEYLEKELFKFKMEVESGAYIVPSKMTLKDFVKNEWDPKYAATELSPLARKTYKIFYYTHIDPAIGHYQFDEIKTMHIVNLMSELSKPGARKDGRGDTLSPRTIQNIYSVLRNLFSVAQDWKLIKNNPMDGIKKPKVPRKKPNYYESAEAKEVIKALYSEPIMWRMFFLGSLIGGLRRGELIALEWPDVRFDKNALFIRKSISLVISGHPSNEFEKPTKGEEEEYVEMPQWYMEEMAIYYEQWKEEKEKFADLWEGGDSQYVFHNGRGKSLYHTTPTGRWKQFVTDHGLRFIRLHDLRHSSATLLIEEGASLKAIQERLRHKQYQTTADTYTHVTKKVSRELADKFNSYNPKISR